MPVLEKPVIENVGKITNIRDVRKAYWDLAKKYEAIVSGAYCSHCGKFKPKSSFYENLHNASGVTSVCKQCAYETAVKKDPKTGEDVVTKESIITAMRLLDKPFIESLYDTAVAETNEQTTKQHGHKNAWTSMITTLSSLPQYRGMNFTDSEYDKDKSIGLLEDTTTSETISMYERNKKTVIAALGYDPFSTASLEDQPLMYSKLAGLLDESTNEDEVKLGACVEITHSFNQTEKLNQIINKLQQNPDMMIKNASTVKALEATKKDTFNSMLALAKENGITVNSSNKNTKGANTWTGIVKEMKELRLREAENNAFDIGTSKGMAQVAELSNTAILKTSALDENDYTEMVANQRRMLDDLNSKCAAAEEQARILKRENNDLKDYLRSKKLINDNDEILE